jgi:histidinol-phosphate aminotransferase
MSWRIFGMASPGTPGRLRLNPNLAALPPYNGGVNVRIARERGGRDDVARLGSNESPDGCSNGEIARVLRAAKTPFNVNAAALAEALR